MYIGAICVVCIDETTDNVAKLSSVTNVFAV